MTSLNGTRARARKVRRHRPALSVALTAGAVGGALLLSACSSSGSSASSGNTAAAGGTSTATAPAGSSASASSSASGPAAAVAAARKEVTSYPAPGPAFNASSLRGKTVYYVPITLKAESFQIVSESLTAALKPVGVKVVACDGGANPSTAAACFNQALGQHAAGVIADAIPYGLAANAFTSLKAAGIPVLIVNQLPPSGQKDNDQLAYMPGNAVQMLDTSADWIAADSGGKANILAQEFTDSPNTVSYLEDYAFPTLKAGCPECTVTVNKVSSANFGLIPSSTSSALLKNPDNSYLWSEFDTILQPTAQGVQQASASSRLKGVSADGLLGAMQMLKEHSFLYADVATDYNYQAWANADMIMRMALKLPLPKLEPIPLRLFDRTNISQVSNITSAGEMSGEWFGPTTYKTMFPKLWQAA
jgi:ribose transport system substrate-binding protein